MPYTHLAQEERFLISKLFQAGWSRRKIAGELGCHHTTISREVKRNKAKRGYRHKQAEEFAKRRRKEASSVSPQDDRRALDKGEEPAGRRALESRSDSRKASS